MSRNQSSDLPTKRFRHDKPYSAMGEEEKADVRKEERREKKEKSRTLAYFTSLRSALEDADRSSADGSTVNLIVSGFTTELARYVSSNDDLLNSKEICRVIEHVMTRTTMLEHIEAFYHIFSDKLIQFMTAPTSSYVIETLFAAAYRALDIAGEPEEGEVHRIDELLAAAADQMVQNMETLAADSCGSKCLHSILLMLCGFPIRDVPTANARRQWFPNIALSIADSFVSSVRKWGVGIAGWRSCCQAATSATILQALLRCATVSEDIERTVVTNGFESVPALITGLLHEDIGVRVLQSYLRMSSANEDFQGWGRCFDLLVNNIDDILDLDSWNENETPPACFALQDIFLYAPSGEALARAFDALVKGRISRYIEATPLTWVLVRLTRKIAYGESAAEIETPETEPEGAESATIDALTKVQLRKDVVQGVRYFPTDAGFKTAVVNELCSEMKKRNTKGAAHVLLVDKIGGDTGIDVANNVVRFGRKSAATFLHSLDKVKVDDLIALAQTSRGSMFLQSVADVISIDADANPPKDGQPAKSMFHRFFRRLSSSLVTLAKDRFGSYVVQKLYDVGPIDVKESVAKVLGENHDVLKTDFYGNKVCVKCCVEQFLYRNEEWKKLAERSSNIKKMLRKILATDASA